MREIKDNKKKSYKYVGQKRNMKKAVGPLLHSMGELLTGDEKKIELLNSCFISGFTKS